MAMAHRFLFAAPRPHPDRPPSVALTRDHVANDELEAAMMAQGFGYGRSVLNFPPTQRRFDLLPFENLFQVELPFVEPGDVLVQTTRPPLSDAHQDDRKKVEPSNTTVERATFLHWWRYFSRCSRSSVRLRDEVASLLPDGYRNRQYMTFHQVGAHYLGLQERGRRPSGENPAGSRTAAFLLRVDELVPGGPGLVAAWGPNAETTLAWNRMLRHRYSYLLENRGLSMVEILPSKRPGRISTYDYMDDWQAEVLFETGVEMPPRPEEKGFAIAF